MLGICSSWARTRPVGQDQTGPEPSGLHRDYSDSSSSSSRQDASSRFLIPESKAPEEERYLASASCQSVRVSGTLSSSPFRIPSPPPKCTALSGLPFSPCSNPHLYSAPFLCLILALYICPVLLFLALKLCWGWSLLVSCNAGASVPCGAWLALISISA